MSEQRSFWDERYRGEGMAFGSKANAFLTSEVHRFAPGGHVLVPGDGQGRNGVWLAERGFKVDSIDISPIAVESAQKLAQSRGVSVNAQVGDLLAWHWPRDVYDAVAVLYVHFFDQDRTRLHQAMLAALKPGGVFLLEAFAIGQIEMQRRGSSGGPKTTDMLYSKSKLEQDFEGCEVFLLEEAEITLDEGHRHKGPAAILRALVQRP